MNNAEVQQTLSNYEGELTGILSRFDRTRERIYIQLDDDARLRQLVIELVDFLNDTLDKNSYSSMIVNYYNEGVSRGSASYASVESIRSVVSSVITRIKRNPDLLSRDDSASKANTKQGASELVFPEKVTINWLFSHVPVKYWISFLGLLLALFMLGIQASRISFVREIFNLCDQSSRTSLESSERPDLQTGPNSVSIKSSPNE